MQLPKMICISSTSMGTIFIFACRLNVIIFKPKTLCSSTSWTHDKHAHSFFIRARTHPLCTRTSLLFQKSFCPGSFIKKPCRAKDNRSACNKSSNLCPRCPAPMHSKVNPKRHSDKMMSTCCFPSSSVQLLIWSSKEAWTCCCVKHIQLYMHTHSPFSRKPLQRMANEFSSMEQLDSNAFRRNLDKG